MIYYITNQTQIDPVFKACTVEDMLFYFKDHKDIQVDGETTGFFDFKSQILLLQLGDFNNQYVLNFGELTKNQRDKINTQIFLNPNICKIFQNAKFDIKFLWLHGFDIINVYDTMLAEILLNAGKDTPDGFYSLFSLGKRYCNIELDKETRGKIHSYGFSSRVIEYAANDVKYLEVIKNKQVEELQKLELANHDCQDIYTVCGLEMNAVIVFASLEYNGIKLDMDKWQEVQKLVLAEQDIVARSVNEIVWQEPKLKKFQYIYQDLFTTAYNTTTVNWASPVQKLKVLKKLFPEIQDTSERVMSQYKSKHPIIGRLLDFNKINKLDSFAKKMPEHINETTKRIHTDFWQILDTGRVSSNKPNMQQVPSRTELGGKMRSCFVPEEGYKMVGGDYSGCELRIIAEFSKDPVWVNAFKEGKDLHSELCAITFGIDIKDVKTNTPFKPELKYRDVQKTLNFGLAYGMSEYKLADTIEITVDQARAIINKFFKAVPKVQQFLNTLGELGKSRGYIKTAKPYGRIRWFDGWDSHDYKRLGEIERQSKNHPIQGGNADMTKLALVLLYRTIKENNYPVKLIHQVHDEIQTEVKEDFAEDWAKIMETTMNEAAGAILKEVPMVVDCKVADYWSK